MMAKELSTSAASIRSAVSIVQAASQQIQVADGNMRGAIAAIHATVALAKQLPSLPLCIPPQRGRGLLRLRQAAPSRHGARGVK